MHLQVPLQGRDLQLLCALIHAIWRCRCMIVRGFSFSGVADMFDHIRSLIDHPWLHGSPLPLSRVERRLQRAAPPTMPHDHALYFADGASRNGHEGRLASYGVVLYIDGVMVSKRGVFIGDETNNVAEYLGALTALDHIRRMSIPRSKLRLDSLLVVKQLTGVWRCMAFNLQPLYEAGLATISQIQLSDWFENMEIQHIYREYNADADALANESIDLSIQRSRTDRSYVAVDMNWDLALLTERGRSAIYSTSSGP